MIAQRLARTFGIPAAFAVVVVIVWQTLVGWGSLPSAVAAPTDIWTEFTDDPSGLWYHVHPTLVSVIKGFAYATGLAVLVSLMTAALPKTTGTVYSVAVVTYSVPLIALAPVLMVWIGTGAALRTTIAAIASFFPVVVGCIQGFNAVDEARAELFRQLSATRLQQFKHLVLPESLPYVFSGMKIGAAAAVLGAIISEWSGASRGLGRAMVATLASYNPPGVWLTIVTSTILTIGLYASVGLTERFLVRWEFDRDAVASRS